MIWNNDLFVVAFCETLGPWAFACLLAAWDYQAMSNEEAA